MPAIAESLLPSEEDLLYEEEILRNPFSLKLWWRYLQARKGVPTKKRYLIFERALHALPGSYKLWAAYLGERKKAIRGFCINNPEYAKLNNTYERALVTMHKMPRIWTDYLQLLMDQKVVTRCRRTFDRALCSLPVTQHDRIWELYLRFVRQEGVPTETALRVYRRYLKLEPTHIEDYIEFLTSAQHWQEAATQLARVLNDEEFFSLKGKTKHQLWLELCELLTRHAADISGLKVDAIIRGGIRKFSDEVGRLWTSLADFYIRRGLFESARDVYEEGMAAVVTVRDFSIIFDAYAQYEESMLNARMETLDMAADDDDEEEAEAAAARGAGDGGGEEKDWLYEENDIDLRLARLEALMERRPVLVNSVLLRQNPHNVHEWHKRAKLFAGDPARQITTYTEAVRTVDCQLALGKPYTLWLAFARLYEDHGEVANARVVLEKAVQARHKSADDLADVWCAWGEMELRHKNFAGARDLLKRATSQPPAAVRRQAAVEGVELAQLAVHRSLKLWAMRTDIEESLGGVASVRPLYEQILDLKIATPQIIINYATLLEESKYFEDAFKVYERGVHIFKYPHVKTIWEAYLRKFVMRYGGKKLERARDLFEQALENAPKEECRALYLEYAKLEEDYGLARHAMAVYDRAAKAVPDEQKLAVYELFIKRAQEYFGVPRTRDIYEQAIESGLPDKDVKEMCIKYAELERSLGEVDRARMIYVHASQMADPRSDTRFWDAWNRFEIAHGNEDTFREMLRIKRSVSASYSQMHFILPEYLMAKAPGKSQAPPPAGAGPPGGARMDHMAALEQQAAAAGGAGAGAAGGNRGPQFVSAGAVGGDDSTLPADRAPETTKVNPEEIELGDIAEEEEEAAEEKKVAAGSASAQPRGEEIELVEEDEEEEGEEGEGRKVSTVDVSLKDVPSGIYGSLAEKAAEISARQAEEAEEPTTGSRQVAGNGGGIGARRTAESDEPVGALERFKRQRRD